MGFLLFRIENKAIPNSTVAIGETLSFMLSDYFSDPEKDELTFPSTKGTVAFTPTLL